jgi:hypothetical protein
MTHWGLMCQKQIIIIIIITIIITKPNKYLNLIQDKRSELESSKRREYPFSIRTKISRIHRSPDQPRFHSDGIT